MENFWSLLKRGIGGTYDSVAAFHFFSYVDEQVYRFGSGATDVIQLFRMLRSAFPDLRAEIIEQFVSGDFVATRKTFHGTHLGNFPGVPPAGKKASLRVVDFVRVTDGKRRGHWHAVAPAALFSQLQSSALHHAPQRV